MGDRRPGFQPLPPAQFVLLGIATVFLVLIIAAASRPGDAAVEAPPGSAAASVAVARALVVLAFIGEAVVIGLLVWAMWPGERRRRLRSRGGMLAMAVASFLQTATALVLFWLYLRYLRQVGATGKGGPLSGIFLFNTHLPAIPDRPTTALPGQDWITVAIVAVVLLVVARLALRGAGFGRRRGGLRRLAEQLQDAMEEGLEELESEPDPRQAVIAAYARMERSLARVGVPRARHETALEYLDRLLGMLRLDGSAAGRLTHLFQEAKFSRHDVGESMKRDAIRALVEVRNDLRRRADEPEPAAGAQPA